MVFTTEVSKTIFVRKLTELISLKYRNVKWEVGCYGQCSLCLCPLTLTNGLL